MPDRVKRYQLITALEQVCDTLNAPGAIVGLAFEGEAPLIVATGISDTVSQRKLLPGDRLRVGSITKTFTAVATLHLVEAGILQLDDPVSHWAPYVPFADTITVKHLLSHTSGLFNYTASPAFFAAVQTATGTPRIWRPVELIAFATGDNQLFPPGKGWSYSNTNYILLGLILQVASHQSLAHLYRQRIFAPLALTATFLDGEEIIPGGFAPGYVASPEDPAQFSEVTNHMHVSAAWAAGGIVSTAKDLLTFSRALFSGNSRGLPPSPA